MLSSKLTVGVHILTLLRVDPGPAPDLGAHRRERQHESRGHPPPARPAPRGRDRQDPQGGIGGGWRLKVPAGRITLLDVLRAVEPQGETIALHRSEPNPLCPVGRNIQGILTAVYSKVERADGRSARQDDHRGHPGLGPGTGTGLSLSCPLV